MENKYNKYPIVANSFFIQSFKRHNTKQHFNCLEIGCNAGHNLKALNQLFPKGEYYGSDINNEAIAQARENFPKGHFMLNDITQENLHHSYFLPKFDYILLLDVLEHLTQPKQVLQYIKKQFLKPEGFVFVTIPNVMHWSILYNLLYNGLFTYTNIGLLNYDHKHLFTRKEFNNLCMSTKFKIIDSYGIDLNYGNYNKEIQDFITSLSSYGQDEISYKIFSYLFIIQQEEHND